MERKKIEKQIAEQIPEWAKETWDVALGESDLVISTKNDRSTYISIQLIEKVEEIEFNEIEIKSKEDWVSIKVRFMFPNFWITTHVTIYADSRLHSCQMITA